MNIPTSSGGERRRGRRVAERQSATALMNLGRFASMIDLSFLLLIFFITTTRFGRPEGVLSAPMPRESGAAAGVPLPLTPIVVRLRQTDLSVEELEIVVDGMTPPPASFRELIGVLQQAQQRPGYDRDTPLVLIAQDDVPWDHVVSAWNAALRAGCTRIAFGNAP